LPRLAFVCNCPTSAPPCLLLPSSWAYRFLPPCPVFILFFILLKILLVYFPKLTKSIFFCLKFKCSKCQWEIQGLTFCVWTWEG
jgi:hypothetical protein